MNTISDKFENFINEIKKNDLNVLESLVWDNGTTVGFSRNGNQLREVYSISKLVTGLTVIKAIELGLFTPETPVMNFFGDVNIYNKDNLPYLQQLKIKHLLTLTIGQDRTLVNESFIKENIDMEESYVSYVLNYPIKYSPGDTFFYTNACNYLLVAILEMVSKNGFENFVDEVIFKPLKITELKWRKSKDGLCLGATGLNLKIHDLLKIGQLLLDNGKYEGKQVIDGELVKEMKKERVPSEMIRTTHPYVSAVFPKNGYGLNIWLTGDGNYFADGKNGQFLIIMPKERRIIITLSETKNSAEMRQIVDCMQILKF